MKRISLLFAFIISAFLIPAQAPTFQWAKTLTGTSWQRVVNAIAVDSWGNVYTTGYFIGTTDFDPGAGTFNITGDNNGDIFILKLDASGNFVWAKKMGGYGTDLGYSIAVDASGNVYTTGRFDAPADFDPGAGTCNYTPMGLNDVFVSKLNASGNFVWAKKMGGPSTDNAYSIAVDASGSVFTLGSFNLTADFDPGAGTFNLTSSGGYDVYVSKLNSAGNFVWAKSIGGPIDDGAFSLAIDASDNIYTTGVFAATVDFDPGPGTFNLTSAGETDVFISKLNSSGNFVWAKKIGGSSYDQGLFVAPDSQGNVYLRGSCNGNVDLDPGAGTFTLVFNNNGNSFILKLDPAGNFGWALKIPGLFYYSAAVDGAGNIYSTGTFQGTVDFDPGPGVFNLTSVGNGNMFISKSDASGNFVWAIKTDMFSASVISIDVLHNVYTTGSFYGTVDFDPGPGSFTLASAGSYDTFIHKMGTCSPFVNISSTSVLLCAGSSATLTATGANNYLWNTGATTASILVSPTVSTTYTVTGIDPNECFTSQTINITVNICTALAPSILKNGSVNIYPNPSTGILNIEINYNNETVSIQLTNTLGKIVLNEKIKDKHSAFDISHLPSGIYFIKVISDHRQQTFKLVKE